MRIIILESFSLEFFLKGFEVYEDAPLESKSKATSAQFSYVYAK